MIKQRPVLVALCLAVMSAFGTTVIAQSPTPSVSTNVQTTRLTQRYSTFAGSDLNAGALVNGLRTGSSVTLETTSTVKNANGTTSTFTTPNTFSPATHQLGYGNVNIALGLAQQQLTKLGITDPTGAEIAAALNGGQVTAADGHMQALPGVLSLRAKGEGWGEVSHHLNLKLGDVVGVSDTRHAGFATEHTSHGHAVALANPPQHVDHPFHADRPQHPDVPRRPDIPDRGGRPGH